MYLLQQGYIFLDHLQWSLLKVGTGAEIWEVFLCNFNEIQMEKPINIKEMQENVIP